MIGNIIFMAAGMLIGVAGYLLRRKSVAAAKEAPENKKLQRRVKLGTLIMVAGGWLFLVQLLTAVFGDMETRGFHVSISPQRFEMFGVSVSSTMILTWVAMGLLLIIALLARWMVIPKMKSIPKGIQSILEIAVDGIDSYASGKVHGAGRGLSSYLFSLALFMIASAFIELFGVRAPTTDLTMTAAMALITLVMINYYGIKRKGVGGRLKSLASPTPVVFVFRVITDCAIPISMACRLFGNMLGGMIVIDLLYSALGVGAVGIPSVVGLYFNVFHPLVQAFIFITLTLTFINEAVE